MIQLSKVVKSFPDRVLFKNMDMLVNRGNRIGLVGPNGSGKTTILRMITGEERPEMGDVVLSKDLSIGYLPQEIIAGSDQSILQEVLGELPEVAHIEGQIQDLTRQLASTPEDQRLLSRLGKLQQEFEHLDGWSLESKAKKVLAGLGFTNDQLATSLEKFSGGWRMRVALAKLLFRNPDILLLDEPTNHLDLESLIWLEGFLNEWPGALVLISHDRTFLDKTVNVIHEIHHQRVNVYSGNYTDYLNQRDLQREQHLSAYKNQQKMIAETERFIERFRYKDSKASQVQSRVKMLDKLERIPPPESDAEGIHVRIPQPGRSVKTLARLQAVDKAYGNNEVFKGLDMALERGQKIGLVGPNGAGKSTLLKMLASVEQPTGGSLSWGEGVDRSYFAQHQFEALPQEATLIELISGANPKWTVTEQRSYLGSFLFSGDSVDKKIKVLSGGEVSRLALANMMATPSHVVLLDEPTNHLDIRSRDVVQEALQQYEGALVCISHDRTFLNAVTNLIIEVGEGGIREYPGNYDYYLWKRGEQREQVTVPTEAPIPNAQAEVQKQGYAERKKRANRLKKLPQLIADIEEELEAQEKLLEDPALASDHVGIQNAMDTKATLEESYLELLEELETLQDQFE